MVFYNLIALLVSEIYPRHGRNHVVYYCDINVNFDLLKRNTCRYAEAKHRLKEVDYEVAAGEPMVPVRNAVFRHPSQSTSTPVPQPWKLYASIAIINVRN